MNTKEYEELAQKTSTTTWWVDKLLNGTLGLSGEAGEFADHVKKWKYQGHKLDTEHLTHELGDILWYIVEAATALDTTLDEIMELNIRKLETRYPDRCFDAARSLNRKREEAIYKALNVSGQAVDSIRADAEEQFKAYIEEDDQ